jgi:hypothetical protein
MPKRSKPHGERKPKDYMEATDSALELSKVLAGEGTGSAKGKVGRPKGLAKAPAAGASGADPLEVAQQVNAVVERYLPATVKGLADLFRQGSHG